MNNVLVVVDMQKDFVTGPLGSPEARAIVPYIMAKIEEARRNGDQIIFTRDTHQRNYLETQEGRNLPVEHCIKGTEGHDIIDTLAAMIDIHDDIVLDKPTFGSNDLVMQIQFIEEAVETINEIQFVGVCTGICVIANAVLAKTNFLETLVTVDASCCACVSPESHETALKAMELLQINVTGR